jgi:hypothetical protein
MSALLSDCGLFRWRLERDIQLSGIVVALIGVNPSTADATVNDHTITKDIGFGIRNGWRKIIKGNVFAFRATDVNRLRTVGNHRHEQNAQHLRQIAADVDMVIPCWGARGKLPRELRPQIDTTVALLRSSGKPIMTFGFTASGDPLHPLTLAYSTPIQPWPAAG